MSIYTVEITAAEMQPAYCRHPDKPIGVIYMRGVGIAKTIMGARREAMKAFKANERKARLAHMKVYGSDNETPIAGSTTIRLDNKVILQKY